jgi:nucleoside-diphosphate-sugar epimerase
MKLLITGGAGFVGARLARTLLARGDRSPTSSRRRPT